MQAKLKAIIGLGNPETKYNSTRHNTGFIVVDKLLQVKNIRLSEKDFNLIKSTADRMNLTVSKMILSLLIPYCLNSLNLVK